MPEVYPIFNPNINHSDATYSKFLEDDYNRVRAELQKIECTLEDFKIKQKKEIILKSDKYRPTNHFIKFNDIEKFPDHEVGAEGVLLTKYYGAIGKAVMLGAEVWRIEGKEFRRIVI